jgi:hypothetical protein
MYDSLAGALQLSINWDRIDVFLSICRQLSELTDGAFTPAHRKALQRTLELQRTSMMRHLLAVR